MNQFNRISQDRDAAPARPEVPDFSFPLSNPSEDATTAFERVSQQREHERLANSRAAAATGVQVPPTATYHDQGAYPRQASGPASLAPATIAGQTIVTAPGARLPIPTAAVGVTGAAVRMQANDSFDEYQRNANAATNNMLERRAHEIATTAVYDTPILPLTRLPAIHDQTMLVAPPTIPSYSAEIRPANHVANSVDDALLPPPTAAQGLIIPRQPVIAYKEVEHNVLVTSADRDWRRSAENRYNFKLLFDAGSNAMVRDTNPSRLTVSSADQSEFTSCLTTTCPSKVYYRHYQTPAQAQVNIAFRNIVRIEVIKAIVPSESLDTFVGVTTGGTLVTSYTPNVLGLPYVNLTFKEHTANNHGTSSALDTAFGVLQYDATWTPDSTTNNKGFVCLVPKFMHCNRVFHPAPLDRLRMLTVQFTRPDGSAMSAIPDAIQLNAVVFPADINGASGGITFADTTMYADTDTNLTSDAAQLRYIYLRTQTHFNASMFATLDRIAVQYYDPVNATPAAAALAAFVERPEGHVVVGVAHTAWNDDHTTATMTTGANGSGLANFIVIAAPVAAPNQYGVASREFFGGSSTAEATLRTTLQTALFDAPAVNTAAAESTAAYILNRSHQTHLVLRVVTRETDNIADIRPDNI
jgi:hypothetical protein